MEEYRVYYSGLLELLYGTVRAQAGECDVNLTIRAEMWLIQPPTCATTRHTSVPSLGQLQSLDAPSPYKSDPCWATTRPNNCFQAAQPGWCEQRVIGPVKIVCSWWAGLSDTSYYFSQNKNPQPPIATLACWPAE